MRTVKIAAAIVACAIQAYGAATVTASRDYVDRKTTLHPYSNGVEQVGYVLGTQTNKVLASKEYVDDSISASSPGDYNTVSNAAVKSRAKTDMVVYDTNGFSTVDRLATTGDVEVAVNRVRTDSITDGTNTIDAAGNVWEVRIVYSNDWSLKTVIGFNEEDVYNYWTWPYWDNDGWCIDKGDGGAVYRLSTNESAIVLLYEEGAKKAIWDRIASGEITNYVGKIALTNDIPSVVDADLTPATNYANQVCALVASEATNYTDAVAAEFENGTREVGYASDANTAFYLAGDDDTYNATELIRKSTNAAIAVADAKISTNNAAFVSAVLAVPLTGADAADISEISEYGGYGTVGAALLALIAGLAALKRRVTSAETALAQKASLSDLPYRLVTPGVWEFSDGGRYVISDVIEGSDGWYFSLDGISPSEPAFNTRAEAESALVLNFPYVDITATRASLPGHLLDRAVNAVPVSSATEITLPNKIAGGKSRDFYVRLSVSAESAVTFAATDSGGDAVAWDSMGDPSGTLEEGTYLYRLTEVADGVFHAADVTSGGSIDPAVLNGKLAATSAAPAFDPAKTYSVGEYVTYEGVLYECSIAVTKADAWTGSKNWTATDMTSPDATLDIMSDGRLRVVTVAGEDLWMQGYDLESTSAQVLKCEKVNLLKFPVTTAEPFDSTKNYDVGESAVYSGMVYKFTAAHSAGAWIGTDAAVDSVPLTMPYVPVGKVGDFVLDVDNSANASVKMVAELSGLFTAFDVFVDKGRNLSDLLTFDGGEQCELYFTMTAFGTQAKPAWKVVKQVVEKQESGS
jgi:hypothetical protein